MVDHDLLAQAEEAYSREKQRERLFFIRFILISVTIATLAVSSLVFIGWGILNDLRRLAVTTCEELLVHHRIENERKHHAILHNQFVLSQKDQSDTKLRLPEETSIRKPRFCRQYGGDDD